MHIKLRRDTFYRCEPLITIGDGIRYSSVPAVCSVTICECDEISVRVVIINLGASGVSTGSTEHENELSYPFGISIEQSSRRHSELGQTDRVFFVRVRCTRKRDYLTGPC